MQLIHAALLLHSAKKEITEDAIKRILQAAGEKADEARIRSLVSSLKEVNIDEAIRQSVAAPAAAAPAVEAKEKKEEKKEDETKKAEEAAAGLGSLFG